MGRTASVKRTEKRAKHIPQPHGTNGNSHEAPVHKRIQMGRLLLERSLTPLQRIVQQGKFLTDLHATKGIDIDGTREFFSAEVFVDTIKRPPLDLLKLRARVK